MRSVALLLLVTLVVCSTTNVPMSQCKLARATWYPIARNSTDNEPKGTCGFGTVAHSMPSFFQSGYVSAPDDETYNGYPFLSPPITITTGGVGRSCGECFEVTGPIGRIVVMSADVCDKGCCANCQGTTGSDVQNFDIDTAVWQTISEAAGGNVVIAYRKVSCDIANPLSFFFNSLTEGTPQATYFRLRPFNQIVAVATIEVKGSAAGGTKGAWTALTRGWVGNYDWSGKGDIGAPFQVRITSILGDVVVFPQNILSTDLQPAKIFSSGTQFLAPSAGYGGSTTTPCVWPGPNTTIFDDKQEGLTVGNLIFRDWGGTGINFASTTNPHSGSKCIDAGVLGGWGIIQLGYQTPFPASMFTGVAFWIRTDGAVASYSKIKICWKYNGVNPTASSSWLSFPQPITSTWQYVSFTMASFTGLPPKINVIMIQNTQATSSVVRIFLDDIKFSADTPSPYYS